MTTQAPQVAPGAAPAPRPVTLELNEAQVVLLLQALESVPVSGSQAITLWANTKNTLIEQANAQLNPKKTDEPDTQTASATKPDQPAHPTKVKK